MLILIACIVCTSCGVKSDPEYKSESVYTKAIRLT